MTVVDPIPATVWGKADWQDYISNWRDKDATWVMERTILRYDTNAKRDSEWPSPNTGQVIYNDSTKALEMYRVNAWVHALMFQFLTSVQDSSAGVNISHTAASGGAGIVITPTAINVTANLNAFSGALTVDASGVGMMSPGQKKAYFTSNATELVLDTPLALPSIRLTATSGNVIDATGKAMVTGALTATSITSSGAINATGAVTAGSLSTAGALSAASATFGGISFASNIGTYPAGGAAANAAGIQLGQGYLYGDANSLVMRQRTSAGVAAGAAYVQTQANDVVINGPTTVQLVGGDIRVMGTNNIDFYTGTTKLGVGIGPVVQSASDPGVGNYPEGTIWIS